MFVYINTTKHHSTLLNFVKMSGLNVGYRCCCRVTLMLVYVEPVGLVFVLSISNTDRTETASLGVLSLPSRAVMTSQY